MMTKKSSFGLGRFLPVGFLVLACLIWGPVPPADAKTPLVNFETGESLGSNIKARKQGDLITIIITERAPANARWLSNSGLPVALTSSKLRNDEDFFAVEIG